MTRRPGVVLGWATIITIVALVASPIIVLAWSLTDISTDVWSELWRTRLPGMITDTIVLVTTVVTGAIVLGVSLAWLVSAYEFPFRRVIGWLLVTPLAIPVTSVGSCGCTI